MTTPARSPDTTRPGGTPIVEPGDRVRDPIDHEWRTVATIEGTTVFMTDGGCMGLHECAATEIRLPDEPLPGFLAVSHDHEVELLARTLEDALAELQDADSRFREQSYNIICADSRTELATSIATNI